MNKVKLTANSWKKIEQFNEFVDEKRIKYQHSRLIPLLKTGDEQALTSIFLSSLRLIKEFRNKIFNEIKLKKNGKIYFFTEVCFEDIDSKSFLDGLIIVVSKGKIIDSAIVEVKNNKNLIDENQILRYYNIAKTLEINKIVTISNQFVSHPSHSVVNIKNKSKKVDLFHLSWTYIQTIASLLISENDDDIQDEDQVEIMKEVLNYLGDERSGVNGFHQMSDGWVKVSEDIKNQITPKNDDLEDAVLSWHQEIVDMKLLLSRKLGVKVKTNNENPSKRIVNDIKKLKTKNFLSTIFKIDGAVSDIEIKSEFERRILQMSVDIRPPLDSGTIARLNWLKRQLDKLDKTITSKLIIEASVKFYSKPIKFEFSDYENFYDYLDIKNKDLTSFKISLINPSKFTKKKVFVSEIESMIIKFYSELVQNLKSWNPPAPKINNKEKEVAISNED